jgi:hypothetical protein
MRRTVSAMCQITAAIQPSLPLAVTIKASQATPMDPRTHLAHSTCHPTMTALGTTCQAYTASHPRNKIGEEIEEPFEKIEEPFVELKDKTKSLPQKKIVRRIIGNTRLAPGQGPLKYAYPFNIEIGDVLRSGEAPANGS